MNTNTPYDVNGAESPPVSPNIREEASTVLAPPPTGTNNSSEANANNSSEANGNNSPSAYVTPTAPNPTLSTSNANEGGNTQASGLELIDELGPPLPIGTIEAQLDEAEAHGKAFAKPSGKLEQIQDDEGPHHASATLAASLEATNKSPARRHVEIINDNAAPINPFDSTAEESAKPSGKLEQIEDDEGPSENSFAVLAASLEATDKSADKRHVETMNDDAAPTPFSSTEFDDIQTDKIKSKTQTMDNHGHGEEEPTSGSSRDVIEGGDDIETGINPRACEGGVGTTPPVNPTHRGDNNDDVVNEDDEGANMNSAATSNSIMEALVTNRESQSDGIHVAEAYAVEGSDQEVVVATHLEPTSPALPWWKQRRFKIFLTAMFAVMAAMAIAFGVSMSSSSGGEPVVIEVERTNAPTISQAPTITFQPSSSLVPTSLPSVSLRPSVHPSLPPTTTQSPTFTHLESLKIVADDDAAEDYFGSSVAVFGDTLVVGAPYDDDKGVDSGSAYIYYRDLQTMEWIFHQKLVPDDGAVKDWFGWSVAIFEDSLVVGAAGDDDKGDWSGSAYIYYQDPETNGWILQQKLVTDNGAEGDEFGFSVAIYDTTLVVGAHLDNDKGDDSGSAYIYHQDSETKEWILQQKLVPDDGAEYDHFGSSVAIYDNTIVVGAHRDDDNGNDSGSAYIYHQDTETKEWILQQKLVADDGADDDWFGKSVAIYDGTLVVGASGDVYGDESGSAFIYSRDLQTKEWVFQQELVPDDGADDDWFGSSVAIYNNTVIVGASWDDDKGNDSGSAYIYHQVPETKEWILQQKLVPDDGATLDYFGSSVAIYDNTVVVGAYYDDDKGENSGSVYVYSSSYTRAPSPVPSSSLAPSITLNPSAMPTQSAMPSTSSSPTGTCYNVTIAVVYDEYPDETSWEIVSIDSNGAEVVVKSYDEVHEPFTSHAEDVCLPEGEYDFVILDSCGDGFCCEYGDGHYNVTTLDGEMIAQGGAFGDEDRTRFSIPFTPVQPSPT